MSRGADRADRLSTALMLVLSFGTGVLDAATYLGLHGVFTANMTGNVVFVGLGLAGGQDIPLLRAGLALGGFVVGATVVGLLQRGRDAWPNTDGVAAATFCTAAVLVVGTALTLHLYDLSAGGLDLLTAVVASAMGAQAAAARRVAVTDVSTVVVTSTLAGLAADSPLTGDRSGWSVTLRRLGAVLSMACGAVVGAFLLRLGITWPVGLAGTLLLVVGLVTVVRWWRSRSRSRIRRGARS